MGVAAECIAAALGRVIEDESESNEAMARAGFLLLAEGLTELRLLRRAWTEDR